MADMRFESRRAGVEKQLDTLPQLTASQRRFLSVPLMRDGWHILADRADAVAQKHRAGAYAIGPTGVFALVFADTAPDRSDVRQARQRAEETFANLITGRNQYVPHMLEMLVLLPKAGSAQADTMFTTLDLSGFPNHLFSSAPQLTRQRARDIALTVAARSGRLELVSADDAPTAEMTIAEGLFESADLHDDERARMLSRPFREWMAFLDPDQLELVHRRFNGPARLSGPAGTGKSIVAVHRMARFAKHNPGRMLFTSFVKTLPSYHRSSFDQLAPHVGTRAEFVGLHSWARGFLRDRGFKAEPEEPLIETAFSRAWLGTARDALAPINPSPAYWRDEIHRIIKGCGITSLEHYKRVERSRRESIRLDSTRREIVWNQLFLPYQDNLHSRGHLDFNDLIEKATDELRAAPPDDPYGLVVVDEVQDFTLMELRLVHQIAGGTDTSQLLLVGDGQQQVYRGGWRIRDAGIPIVGRGARLRTNYRNRQAILDFARQVDAVNTVDDLDGAPGFVIRDSEPVLPGGEAGAETITEDTLDAKVLARMHDCGFAPGDIAVITTTRKDSRRIRMLLERNTFHTISLEHYDGTDDDRVKVGTVHRAKGMDFAAVVHIVRPSALPTDSEHAARQILVARSRARDFVWEYRIDE